MITRKLLKHIPKLLKHLPKKW